MQKSDILNPAGPSELDECSIYDITMGKNLMSGVMMAVRDADKQLGFQYWPELLTSDAMLFFFPDEQVRSMHMRNVAFPLLMSWINKDHIVVSQIRAMPSDTQLYSSEKPAMYCLESHPALLSRLQIGDELEFIRDKKTT